MEVSYTEGPGLVVVGPAAVVLLPGDTDPRLALNLAARIRAGGGLGEVLVAIASAFPTGLADVPAFAAVARTTEGVTLAARGPVVVRVHTGVGDADVDGAGVTSWREGTFRDVGVVELAPDAPQAGGVPLPLGSGVARAASVRWAVSSGADGDAVRDAPLHGSGDPVPAPPQPITEVEQTRPADADAGAEPDSPAEQSGAPRQDARDATLVDVPACEVTLGGATQPPEEPPSSPPGEAEAAGSGDGQVGGGHGYDHLWEVTVARKVEDAAVRAGEDGDASPDEGGEDLNHDGETIMSARLAELRCGARSGRRRGAAGCGCDLPGSNRPGEAVCLRAPEPAGTVRVPGLRGLGERRCGPGVQAGTRARAVRLRNGRGARQFHGAGQAPPAESGLG